MASDRDDRSASVSQRCMNWLTGTSVVFAVAAVIVAALTFVTTAPTAASVGVLVLALAPWLLVARRIELPPVVLVVVSTAAIGWLVLRLDDSGSMFLSVVVISWTAAQGQRLTSLVCFVANTAIVVIASMSGHDGFAHAGAVSWITGLAMGWFLGLLVNHHRRLTDDLSEARHELALAAVRHERTMVAREVHDIVGHGLTVALLNITGARRQLAKNPDAAAEALDRAEAVTRDSLETVRNVVGLLSSEGQQHTPMPGGRDIAAIVEQAERSGMPVSVAITGDPAGLEPAVGLTLVRLLQESLSNANRHAPGAQIDVSLVVTSTDVTAVVANAMPISDGPSTSNRCGLGIAGMTDRVAAVRGTLDVGRRGERWVVRCVLPRTSHADRGIVAGRGPT